MKITLYLENKLMEFKLPNEIEGSFSFDEELKKDSKLINVEAKNDKWYLYSTNDSVIMDGINNIKSIELISNTFYTLKKDNKLFLIFVSDLKDNKILAYTYNQNMNILLGNDENCNIIYNRPFLNRAILNIKINNNQIVLNSNAKDNVYINNKRVVNSIIKSGDKITTYGVNILFMNNMLLINNSKDLITINEQKASITKKTLAISNEKSNEEVKDKELYTEDMFFSKSPRIRRFIETKEFKLDQPPRNNQSEDLPLLLTIGPMITMGASSIMMLVNTMMRINSGETTFKASWVQLTTSGLMVVSMLLWPTLTRKYQKKRQKDLKQEIITKYNKYLTEKEKELSIESKLQHDILIENLISLEECIDTINKKGILFWNKRNDENDFLTVRVGIGSEKLDTNIQYPEEGFTIEEDELKKSADKLIEKYKYIENVPIGYSLYKNTITAVMGDKNKSYNFVNNILLQLLTFYSYEDIKLVFFTTEENKSYFEYGKYLKHTFSDDMNYRFFASHNDSYQTLSEYINMTINNRINSTEKQDTPHKPYYIIVIDNYEDIKKFDFVNIIAESENNLGFSIILIENRLSKLPSKCNNFISLTGNQAGILKNSFETQEQMSFKEEINYQINMMKLSKILSNIPIEFEEGLKYLPESISFLEMEHVGKVEQLNILNRWKTNDPTVSLKTEVGVDDLGSTMYLDLHEKYHGPHGLIAGTTGSGKSEFIITYILSMCMNYSPEYVSFILIDYKGGGLAGAFENKIQDIVLPHLAGTITNLDKAEMDRTLVSIDSEAKRRQKIFNETRDKLGESTIDIYKYQSFYREGRVDEPLPHLFIICDEFAELKAQQPDFMDNLISIARIGRSLGVHLILATQKPSGVVNDQIWSNTKFRVCLKVQTEADSKEMLKKADAAHIKQAGRFYLQVGYDEYFALGQSGWCGAKYYPSNQIVKEVDKSVNFINDCGNFIKSIKLSNGQKITAEGEQLGAILKAIIETAKKEKLKSKRLWLDNIPNQISLEYIKQKYKVERNSNEIIAIIGEYDAPENQEQGIVEFNLSNQGNTIIYGIDSVERELLLSTIIYDTCINYSPEEVNYYMIDYGSESLRKFLNYPQFGGMVFADDGEKYKNFIKMLQRELKERKKLLSNYGGEYKNYLNISNEKLPLKVIILNNYDSIYENNNDIYEYFPELVRDSERYGMVYIITANASNSVSNRINQNFTNIYAYKMKDNQEYFSIFQSRKKVEPRDVFGRGLLDNGELHEFQTACITTEDINESENIINIGNELRKKYQSNAEKIPTLPNKVTYEYVSTKIKNINSVPIGISKDELNIIKYNFTEYIGTTITSLKINYTKRFILSICYIFTQIKNTNVICIDASNKFEEIKTITKKYYKDNFDEILNKLKDYYTNSNENNEILLVVSVDKLLNTLKDNSIFSDLVELIKNSDNKRIIIVDDINKIKAHTIDSWYTKTFSNNDGIWIGKGISDQNIFRITGINRELMKPISNDYGIMVKEGTATIIKLLDFYNIKDGDEDE